MKQDETELSNAKSIRVELDQTLVQDFNTCKKFYGVKSDTEVVRLLIAEKSRTIGG